MSNSQVTNKEVLQDDDGDVLRNFGFGSLALVIFMLVLGVGLMFLL